MQRPKFELGRYPWVVVCLGEPEIGHYGCGNVVLTDEEYDHQMRRPDVTWRCPICGFEAAWNDENYDEWCNDQGKEVTENA